MSCRMFPAVRCRQMAPGAGYGSPWSGKALPLHLKWAAGRLFEPVIRPFFRDLLL